MSHYHPIHPCFTINICERAILRENFRLIDVGVRGGLQDHWFFFGDRLEAWGFDPLYEEGVAPLIAANKHPDRLHYLNLALGEEDDKRPFRFISENPSSSFVAAANGSDRVDDSWRTVSLRRLDSLFAEGTLGQIDFMKMDAETYEVEIIKGGQEFLKLSGLFGIESEVNFFRTPRNPRSHFVELYEELAPHGFMVYDAGLQRAPRAPLAKGFPQDAGNGRYTRRPIGRPVVFDLLFLSKSFDEPEMQTKSSIDRLLKLISVSELYGLQDVALDILFRNKDRLGARLDIEQAADWLVREEMNSTLTYEQYRTGAIQWGDVGGTHAGLPELDVGEVCLLSGRPPAVCPVPPPESEATTPRSQERDGFARAVYAELQRHEPSTLRSSSDA